MIFNWNPQVNTKFSLEGDVILQEDFIQVLQFASGKKRTWLRNSFVPRVFPSLNLMLNNKRAFDEKTEFEEFDEWFSKTLRYGVFPFVTEKLGYKTGPYIKTPAMGVYKFLGPPEYDRLDGHVLATFGLEEESVIPEVRFAYLTAQTGDILLTGNGNMIIALGV